jgi:hypothetical protein
MPLMPAENFGFTEASHKTTLSCWNLYANRLDI